MKIICNRAFIDNRCKTCHHVAEHDPQLIPFDKETGLQPCTVEGHCNIADRDVCCEPIGSEASHEM